MKRAVLACLLLYSPSIAAYELDLLDIGRNRSKLVVDCPNGSRVYRDLDGVDLAALDLDHLADQIKKECGDEANRMETREVGGIVR